MITVKTHREALDTEVARLTTEAGKPKTIWKMLKPELVEVARTELGYSITQAEALKVQILRERIKNHRKAQTMVSDPLAKQPEGFSHLRKHELLEEMAKRNIPVTGPKMSNGAMMDLIQQDIDYRADQEKLKLADWTEEMEVTTSGNGFAMDEEMSIATPRRKSKSRSSNSR